MSDVRVTRNIERTSQAAKGTFANGASKGSLFSAGYLDTRYTHYLVCLACVYIVVFCDFRTF